jgi:hypothetical protein
MLAQDRYIHASESLPVACQAACVAQPQPDRQCAAPDQEFGALTEELASRLLVRVSAGVSTYLPPVPLWYCSWGIEKYHLPWHRASEFAMQAS